MRSPPFWQEVGIATVITQDNYVLLHVGRSLTICEVELARTVRLMFRLQIVMAARALAANSWSTMTFPLADDLQPQAA